MILRIAPKRAMPMIMMTDSVSGSDTAAGRDENEPDSPAQACEDSDASVTDDVEVGHPQPSEDDHSSSAQETSPADAFSNFASTKMSRCLFSRGFKRKSRCVRNHRKRGWWAVGSAM